MTLKFKGISIKNFKSLHELNVRMQDFNVIVGKNASGKTNFIEFFKFLKELLVKKERPLMPFIEWWGFENIVWNRDEKLPIQVVLDFDVDGVKCEY
jgi:AAA15 family ATPase/GTPase